MKITPAILLACVAIGSSAPAASLTTQTFEVGNDTSDWGSAGWTDGGVVPTFLDESLGGFNAGSGDSAEQNFSRSFRENEVGLDVETTSYTIGMYFQIDTIGDPANGVVEIIDGAFGTGNNAANLRVHQAGGGFAWQAYDFSESDWLDVGIDFDLETPYRVVLVIDPISFTYSTTIQLVTTAGIVLDTASLSGLAFNPNVIPNNQNGNLLFYVQAAGAGGAEVLVDNISIVPEPGVTGTLLLGIGLLGLMSLWNRRTSECRCPHARTPRFSPGNIDANQG